MPSSSTTEWSAAQAAEDHLEFMFQDTDWCGCVRCIVNEVLSIALPILSAFKESE